uniref:Uncharacterized protein TCIL3000_10_5510 n=1 Tax=Trypanosoma congolense (strain IL3000) TaxID=1068625 RepID=G0UWL9_TRYCI|nr:unnamed protein product [Trypanosoma congolense IL3000]
MSSLDVNQNGLVAYSCHCTGIRFCGRCVHSDRAQSIINQRIPLVKSSAVVSQQYTGKRTSSCSFTCVEPSRRSICPVCLGIFETDGSLIRECKDHMCLTLCDDIIMDGFCLMTDFISPLEEQKLVTFFDDPAPFPPWKDSQSGRRKQDYGPKANFKKKKLKLGNFQGMPQQMEELLGRVTSFVSRYTNKEFSVAEVSALEYTTKCSSLDPHVDDTWLWGDRIGGLNLLVDVVLTFVNASGIAVAAHIPRRSFFMLSKVCRYEWMHGIRREDIVGRRISVTFRELADKIDVDEDLCRGIKAAASTFV